ncbi:MAG: MFS transporter [Elusimicrobia bacterium]|nr:MFS transporter [Elusimicrobiota bacterium]
MSASPPSAWSSRDFRRLTAARFLLSFAAQIQTLVMAWQVYRLTRDPLHLGLIGLVEAAPALSLALFAGDLVDRRDPLKVYKNVIRGVLVSAAILLTVSLPATKVPPHAQLFWIYAAAFVAGCARGFSQPSLYAIVPQMIPRESLAVSSAWITSAFQTASVFGPAVGGVLFAWRGPATPYAVDAALLVGALLCASAVAFRPAPARSSGERGFDRVTSGLRHVLAHDVLLAALALDMFAVLFGGVEAILPIFAGEILKVGAVGLGLLQAAPSAGALIGSALMIRRPADRGAGRTLLWVVTGFGLCMIAFALSRDMILSMALLALAGGLDSVSMVIRSAIVQLASPDRMRGRVASVNAIFIGVSNELGAFESGVAAKFLGTVPSVVFGGALTLATVAFAAAVSPRLRRLDLGSLKA